MGQYLVRVHEAPPNVTVTVAHNVSEYEIETESLAAACEMVFDKPVRTAPPVTRMHLQNPAHRDYVAPDRSRFDAVVDFTAKSRKSLDLALEQSGRDLAGRAVTATAVAERYIESERSTVHDCVALVDSWDDRSLDHVAEFRKYVENEWYDEEGLGRTWFTELHENLAAAGVDGPTERKLAEGLFWDAARVQVQELDAERGAAPKGP